MNKLITPQSWLNGSLNVIVVGAGGTGSSLITELFQMNYLISQLSGDMQCINVTVFDGDEVSSTNVGRQNFWPHDIGKNKAQVLVERFNTFGGINWAFHDRNFDANDLDRTVNRCDLLITCVDKASVRAMIGNNRLVNTDTLWLDFGNDVNSGQIILGHLSSDVVGDRLPNVFDLYPQLATIIDRNEDSCSHAQALAKQDYGINKRVCLEGTNLIWQLLRHGSISNHGAFVNIKDGTTIPLKIDKIQWSMLGYTHH